MSSVVALSQMREWADAIFDAAERSGVTAIDMSGGNYWMLDTSEVWGASPPEPVLCDLNDDFNDIVRDLTDFDLDQRAAFAWHALDHFIGAQTRLSANLKDDTAATGDRP